MLGAWESTAPLTRWDISLAFHALSRANRLSQHRHNKGAGGRNNNADSLVMIGPSTGKYIHLLATTLNMNAIRKVDKILWLGSARIYFLGEYWLSLIHI